MAQHNTPRHSTAQHRPGEAARGAPPSVFAHSATHSPQVFANSANLEPVMVMLAILLWGSVWGITGMVLAVPITAVIRIYLENIEHPLPRYLAEKLAGSAHVSRLRQDRAKVGPAESAGESAQTACAAEGSAWDAISAAAGGAPRAFPSHALGPELL